MPGPVQGAGGRVVNKTMFCLPEASGLQGLAFFPLHLSLQ